MRRFFLLFILFTTCYFCLGQQTITIENDDGTYSVGILNEESQRTGKWTKYYNSGKIFIVANYLRDTLEGKVISYYKNGKVQAENDYIAGKLNGISKQYDIKGNPIRSISYKENLIFGNCIYYENGEIETERYYKNGVINGPCKDYLNGKISMEYIMLPTGEVTDRICYNTKTGKKKNCGFL